MKGRPWYKRYPADILHGTMALNVAEKGAYNVVLDLMYDRGGPIPDDAKWLSRQCGCSMQHWRTLRASLIDLGKLSITPDGRLSNGRAVVEIARNQAEGESLRQAGQRGGAMRSQNKPADSHGEPAENMPETMKEVGDNNAITEKRLQAAEIGSGSGRGTTKLEKTSEFVGDKLDIFGGDTANNSTLGRKWLEAVPESRVLEGKKERKISSLRSDSCPPLPAAEPAGFAGWYQRYPRKVGRADACKAYVKARKVATEAEIFAGLVSYPFNPDVQYQPMPATWLNKFRWQHEPETPGSKAPAKPGWMISGGL